MQSSGDSQMSKTFTPIEAALNSVQAEICDILYTGGARIDCTGVDCTNIISNDWFFVQIYSAQRLLHSYKYIQQRLVCCTNIFSKCWFIVQIHVYSVTENEDITKVFNWLKCKLIDPRSLKGH